MTATYASYITVDGEQQTLWVTFVATTPTTAPAAPVPAGTIMNAESYLASLSQMAAASGLTGQSSAQRSYNFGTERFIMYIGATAVLGLLGAAVVL